MSGALRFGCALRINGSQDCLELATFGLGLLLHEPPEKGELSRCRGLALVRHDVPLDHGRVRVQLLLSVLALEMPGLAPGHDVVPNHVLLSPHAVLLQASQATNASLFLASAQVLFTVGRGGSCR